MGAVLGIVGYLAASLTCTEYMPVAPTTLPPTLAIVTTLTTRRAVRREIQAVLENTEV